MGLWGAAQAVAFGLGGFAGAGGVDWGRAVFADTGTAFVAVFTLEAMAFAVAAWLALSLGKDAATQSADRSMVRATT